jgi:hypothetical protein
MTHIKTAQDGSHKITMSTPEWIRIGLDRGLLKMDQRVVEYAAHLASAAGIEPGKAPYSTVKKAMQTPEILERLSKNIDENLTKTAQTTMGQNMFGAQPVNSYQQVGQNTGGPGWGTAALGAAGIGLAAPLAFQGGRDMYKGIYTGLQNASLSKTVPGATKAFTKALPSWMGGIGAPVSSRATGIGSALRGVVPVAKGGVGAIGTGLKALAPLALPALALGAGFMTGRAATNWVKDKMKGDATPSSEFASNPQIQNNVMVAIDRFNRVAPALQGMSSSIDEHINAVGAAVTDTIQALQTSQSPTAVAPQFQSEEDQRAAELAQYQQQIAAAQTANQRFMHGPRISAPAGIPGGAAPVATAAR